MSHFPNRWTFFAAATVCLSASAPAQSASDAVKPSEFMRFVPIGKDEGKLEVALTTYVDGADREVTLIAAVHIADPEHYRALQLEFAHYDAMLYELVARKGHRPTHGQRSKGMLSMFQRLLTNGLQLAFQLDAIDYAPRNFVHADLDPTSFFRLQKERGESVLTLMLRAMGRSLQRQHATTSRKPTQPVMSFDLVRAFRNHEGRHHMRMMFAKQLEDIESVAAGFGGRDGTSVLVEGRNARAFAVLREQLAAGKKKLAIYYGAAHMPDMEKRLTAMGFERAEQRWITAWDLHKRLDPVRHHR